MVNLNKENVTIEKKAKRFNAQDVINFIEWNECYFIFGAVATLIIGLLLFIFIPLKETMVVDSYRWNWTIQLSEYTAINEDKWGKTTHRTFGGLGSSDQKKVVPNDAYNVTADFEYHHREKVVTGHYTDSNGNRKEQYHYDNVYKWHYYYTVNRWKESSCLDSYGIDKSPYEPKCEYTTSIASPKLGDIIRQSGHKEIYYISGEIDGKTISYEVPKDVYDKIEKGDEISYKRHRFSSKIYDIKY